MLLEELNALAVALSFFTRLPLSGKNFDLQRAVLYLPVVGLLLGGIAYFSAWFLLFHTPLGVDLVALLVLALSYYLADYFHFDGLLDMVDALAAGGDRSRKLKLLKTPEVGALGVLFSFFFLLGEFLLVRALLQQKILTALWARALVGREALALMALLGSPAKKEGLGFLFLQGARRRIMLTQIGWLPLIYYAPLASGATMLLVWWLRGKCARDFGGLTGDLLGATLCLAQWLFLAVFLVGAGFRPW